MDAALSDCEVQWAVDLLDVRPPIEVIDAVSAADDVRKAAAAEIAQQREVSATVVVQWQMLPQGLLHGGCWAGGQLSQLHAECEQSQD